MQFGLGKAFVQIRTDNPYRIFSKPLDFRHKVIQEVIDKKDKSKEEIHRQAEQFHIKSQLDIFTDRFGDLFEEEYFMKLVQHFKIYEQAENKTVEWDLNGIYVVLSGEIITQIIYPKSMEDYAKKSTVGTYKKRLSIIDNKQIDGFLEINKKIENPLNPSPFQSLIRADKKNLKNWNKQGAIKDRHLLKELNHADMLSNKDKEHSINSCNSPNKSINTLQRQSTVFANSGRKYAKHIQKHQKTVREKSTKDDYNEDNLLLGGDFRESFGYSRSVKTEENENGKVYKISQFQLNDNERKSIASGNFDPELENDIIEEKNEEQEDHSPQVGSKFVHRQSEFRSSYEFKNKDEIQENSENEYTKNLNNDHVSSHFQPTTHYQKQDSIGPFTTGPDEDDNDEESQSPLTVKLVKTKQPFEKLPRPSTPKISISKQGKSIFTKPDELRLSNESKYQRQLSETQLKVHKELEHLHSEEITDGHKFDIMNLLQSHKVKSKNIAIDDGLPKEWWDESSEYFDELLADKEIQIFKKNEVFGDLKLRFHEDNKANKLPDKNKHDLVITESKLQTNTQGNPKVLNTGLSLIDTQINSAKPPIKEQSDTSGKFNPLMPNPLISGKNENVSAPKSFFGALTGDNKGKGKISTILGQKLPEEANDTDTTVKQKIHTRQPTVQLYIQSSKVIKVFNKCHSDAFVLDYKKFITFDLFANERQVFVKEFCSISRRIVTNKLSNIFCEDEPSFSVYFILKGSVKLLKSYNNPDEKNRTTQIKRFSNNIEITIQQQGSLFGYEDIVLKRKRWQTAQVLENESIIYEISFNRFVNFFWKLGDLINNLRINSIIKTKHWEDVYSKKCKHRAKTDKELDWAHHYMDRDEIIQKEKEEEAIAAHQQPQSQEKPIDEEVSATDNSNKDELVLNGKSDDQIRLKKEKEQLIPLILNKLNNVTNEKFGLYDELKKLKRFINENSIVSRNYHDTVSKSTDVRTAGMSALTKANEGIKEYKAFLENHPYYQMTNINDPLRNINTTIPLRDQSQKFSEKYLKDRSIKNMADVFINEDIKERNVTDTNETYNKLNYIHKKVRENFSKKVDKTNLAQEYQSNMESKKSDRNIERPNLDDKVSILRNLFPNFNIDVNVPGMPYPCSPEHSEFTNMQEVFITNQEDSRVYQIAKDYEKEASLMIHSSIMNNNDVKKNEMSNHTGRQDTEGSALSYYRERNSNLISSKENLFKKEISHISLPNKLKPLGSNIINPNIFQTNQERIMNKFDLVTDSKKNPQTKKFNCVKISKENSLLKVHARKGTSHLSSNDKELNDSNIEKRVISGCSSLAKKINIDGPYAVMLPMFMHSHRMVENLKRTAKLKTGSARRYVENVSQGDLQPVYNTLKVENFKREKSGPIRGLCSPSRPIDLNTKKRRIQSSIPINNNRLFSPCKFIQQKNDHDESGIEPWRSESAKVYKEGGDNKINIEIGGYGPQLIKTNETFNNNGPQILRTNSTFKNNEIDSPNNC